MIYSYKAITHFHTLFLLILPVLVVARPKAWFCGRSPAEIVSSNPTVGMYVSVVSLVCFQVEVSASG